MHNQTQWTRGRMLLGLGLSLLLGGSCSTAIAQGFRGGGFGGGGMPAPEEMFKRMDRNQNGQLDPDEIGFMRDMYSRAGVDVSRPISLQEFVQVSQKIREQFEQARSSGGGPPSFGGGPPPSFGGGLPSGSERRPEESSDRDSRRGDRDRDRRDDRDGERRSDSSSGKSSKKTVKPKERVTRDLPAEYRDKDKNGDGQIGLYEWDRKAFSQFYSLDRNGDGLLTADEIIAATKKSTSSSKSAASGSSASPTTMANDSRISTTTEPGKSNDIAKPNTSTSPAPSSPAAAPTVVENSPGVKAFVGLDTDSDGKLTDEEWERSRSAKAKFEKAGVAISFPIQQAQFVEL